jgi:hypothetical protein
VLYLPYLLVYFGFLHQTILSKMTKAKLAQAKLKALKAGVTDPADHDTIKFLHDFFFPENNAPCIVNEGSTSGHGTIKRTHTKFILETNANGLSACTFRPYRSSALWADAGVSATRCQSHLGYTVSSWTGTTSTPLLLGSSTTGVLESGATGGAAAYSSDTQVSNAFSTSAYLMRCKSLVLRMIPIHSDDANGGFILWPKNATLQEYQPSSGTAPTFNDLMTDQESTMIPIEKGKIYEFHSNVPQKEQFFLTEDMKGWGYHQIEKWYTGGFTDMICVYAGTSANAQKFQCEVVQTWEEIPWGSGGATSGVNVTGHPTVSPKLADAATAINAAHTNRTTHGTASEASNVRAFTTAVNKHIQEAHKSAPVKVEYLSDSDISMASPTAFVPMGGQRALSPSSSATAGNYSQPKAKGFAYSVGRDHAKRSKPQPYVNRTQRPRLRGRSRIRPGTRGGRKRRVGSRSKTFSSTGSLFDRLKTGALRELEGAAENYLPSLFG